MNAKTKPEQSAVDWLLAQTEALKRIREQEEPEFCDCGGKASFGPRCTTCHNELADCG